MALRTYDPKEVSMIIAGNIGSGYAEGTYLKVERNSPTWNLKIGADGEGVRAKSNDKSGKFTVTFQQGSPLNDILSGLQNADELNNAGTFTVLIKDNNGTSIHEALKCWVMKPADAEYAKEVGHREWVIETDNLQSFIGGNVQN